MEMKLEKPKEVFSQKKSYTITSYIFFTGVTIEEKQMSELTPFLQQFAHLSWRQFQIFRDLLLFLAEVVESDFLSLRGDISYLFM
jgi:hypothetical protein